jgi:hypothetical protein
MTMYRKVRMLVALAALSATALVTACSSAPAPPSVPPGRASAPDTNSTGGMAGMAMAPGDGLADTAAGYTLAVHSPPAATNPSAPSFMITHGGVPVTAFLPEQTKLMHFYLIRSDLTGFQHVHPTMDPDGTWTAPTTSITPGAYRIYVQFSHTVVATSPRTHLTTSNN